MVWKCTAIAGKDGFCMLFSLSVCSAFSAADSESIGISGGTSEGKMGSRSGVLGVVAPPRLPPVSSPSSVRRTLSEYNRFPYMSMAAKRQSYAVPEGT